MSVFSPLWRLECLWGRSSLWSTAPWLWSRPCLWETSGHKAQVWSKCPSNKSVELQPWHAHLSPGLFLLVVANVPSLHQQWAGERRNRMQLWTLGRSRDARGVVPLSVYRTVAIDHSTRTSLGRVFRAWTSCWTEREKKEKMETRQETVKQGGRKKRWKKKKRMDGVTMEPTMGNDFMLVTFSELFYPLYCWELTM